MGKSLMKMAEKKFAKMNKRGQVIDTVSSSTINLLVLAFIVFAVLFAIATLNPSSFFTANSAEANATEHFQANLTSGIDSFGGNLPSFFKILGIVLIIGGIVLLVLYIMRMKSVAGNQGGGL